jgi:hypothetical protein
MPLPSDAVDLMGQKIVGCGFSVKLIFSLDRFMFLLCRVPVRAQEHRVGKVCPALAGLGGNRGENEDAQQEQGTGF